MKVWLAEDQKGGQSRILELAHPMFVEMAPASQDLGGLWWNSSTHLTGRRSGRPHMAIWFPNVFQLVQLGNENKVPWQPHDIHAYPCLEMLGANARIEDHMVEGTKSGELPTSPLLAAVSSGLRSIFCSSLFLHVPNLMGP